MLENFRVDSINMLDQDISGKRCFISLQLSFQLFHSLLYSIDTFLDFFNRGGIRDSNMIIRPEFYSGNDSNFRFFQEKLSKIDGIFYLFSIMFFAIEFRDIRKCIKGALGIKTFEAGDVV